MQSKKQIIEAAINNYYLLTPLKVDKRKKEIKAALKIGIEPTEILNARIKQIKRRKLIGHNSQVGHADRVQFIMMLKECQYKVDATSCRYNCTGIDWKAYHRPSSNGKGWVLIAPDEPGNNWYIEDAVLLKLLSKKYN